MVHDVTLRAAGAAMIVPVVHIARLSRVVVMLAAVPAVHQQMIAGTGAAAPRGARPAGAPGAPPKGRTT